MRYATVLHLHFTFHLRLRQSLSINLQVDDRNQVRPDTDKQPIVCFAETEAPSLDGWTGEEEIALRNAFFLARPSPHFWKKVSKMVIWPSFIHRSALLIFVVILISYCLNHV